MVNRFGEPGDLEAKVIAWPRLPYILQSNAIAFRECPYAAAGRSLHRSRWRRR